jgi:hypothetical protein
MHPCLQAQLDAIRTAVESGKGRDQIVSLISGYQLRYLTFDSLAKDAAVASDVTVHMPHDHLQEWIDVYSMIPLLDRTNAKEADDVGHLDALSRTGNALLESERERILDAVEVLRQDDEQMFEAVRYTLPQINHYGIKLAPGRKASFTDWAKRRYGACIRELPPGWGKNS